MLDYTGQRSITSLNSQCSSTKSGRSIWSKLSKILHPTRSSSRSSSSSRRISGNYSTSNLSEVSSKSDSDSSSLHRRHRKQLVHADEGSNTQMMIPPFSPTYCKANEFPYSNFYMKLPDGRWMVRYRDGNRDILRTDIMEGYMI
ncbi:hypothetical protein K501DRAFT_286908 [Backusella circina FSU 941]|nr:hypothetical protein K501DRAFT_286908 [Backusella circina FSU 941]